jgi:hypothetical protein
MSSENNASSGGISVLSILGLIFIVLKLAGYIDWSWWWVLAPFWAIPTLAIAGFIFFVIFKLFR